MSRRTAKTASYTGTLSAPSGDHREVAVLADGPWARHRYWRDDLEAMQAASRAVGYPDDHPSAVLRRYHPTADHDGSTGPEGVPVRLWRYQPLQVGPGRLSGPSSPSRHGRGQ